MKAGKKKKPQENEQIWNYWAVQWLGLCASTAGSTGFIPGQEIKILHEMWCGKKERERERERSEIERK